jgi:L-amino acid N-acyltransferase YncA
MEGSELKYTIESLTPADWDQARDIYAQGIATRNATFEVEPPSWEKWDGSHLPFARIAAKCGENLLGWAALSPISQRRCYAGVAEASVYVAELHRGKGIGKTLLCALIQASEQNGIWTLQAGVFPKNEGSLALIKKCGFREVGRRERLGQLDGVWRDVLLLERRSRIVGV